MCIETTPLLTSGSLASDNADLNRMKKIFTLIGSMFEGDLLVVSVNRRNDFID